MADPFLQSLLDGDILGFVTSMYVSVMGQSFYAVVLLIFFGGLYNQTKSLALIAVLWFLLGSVWIVLTAIVSPIAILLCALGVSGIIYSIFGRSS